MKKVFKMFFAAVLLFVFFVMGMFVGEDMDSMESSKHSKVKEVYYQREYRGDHAVVSLKLGFPLCEPGNSPADDSMFYLISNLATDFEMERNRENWKRLPYENFVALIDSVFTAKKTLHDGGNEVLGEVSTSYWEYDREIKILANNENYFTVSRRDISYTGGAHPNSFIRYYNFDKKMNKWFEPNERLTVEEMDRLLPLAEKAFRNVRGLAENEDLEKAGFWFKEGVFKLSRAMALTDSSLVLYYNDYEVASHAQGPTKVEISLTELKEKGVEF